MQRTIEFRGSKISYRTEGDGPAVVLLHGFAEDSRIWRNQVEALKTRFKLILPDLPGSGSSEMLEDMSMEGLAESVHAILKNDQISDCCMIGHSMGGYVTLAFAEKYPELLNSFGLFHSTSYADSEEKIVTRRKAIEFMNVNGAEAFLKNSIPNLFSSCANKTITSEIQNHLNSVTYFKKEALINYYKAMIRRPDRSSLLKQNKMPILFVLGRYDTAVPLEHGLQQAHLPDLAYIHILEKSAHMGMLEEPIEANAILNNFLLKTV